VLDWPPFSEGADLRHFQAAPVGLDETLGSCRQQPRFSEGITNMGEA
jgi:hypothetical protein